MCRDELSQRWAIVLPSPYDRDDAMTFLGARERVWREQAQADFAVTDQASGELLASIGMKPVGDGRTGECGWMAAPAARGRRVVPRAVRPMTDWAFATLGYERIETLIQPGNVASQRAAERAGFVRTQHRRTCCSRSGEALEHLVFVRQRPSPG